MSWVGRAGGCGLVGVLLLLLHKACSNPVKEGDMFLDVGQEGAVGSVPLGIVSADPDDRFAKELDTFVGCLVSFVVAKFVGFLYLSLVNHALCSMTFDLCDGDGRCGFWQRHA